MPLPTATQPAALRSTAAADEVAAVPPVPLESRSRHEKHYNSNGKQWKITIEIHSSWHIPCRFRCTCRCSGRVLEVVSS